MNAHTTYALIAVFAIAGIVSFSPAFGISSFYDEEACPDCEGDTRIEAMIAAQHEIPVSVWTDSAIYDHESMIMVNGKVANTKMGVPVTLTVTSPSYNIVAIQQLDVDNNGEFASTLNTAGNMWKYDGTYTIRVQYGSQEVNNKVLVQLTGGIIGGSTSVSCGASEVAATDQCIPFSITGGMVTGADINDKDNSIIVRISADQDGEITLNPSTNTIGGIFMVLVDGEEWDDATIDGNKVTIMFPAGTEEIEIIGTFVIPEFGTIAVMILAVAIVSIIAVTSRSRLSVMPKF